MARVDLVDETYVVAAPEAVAAVVADPRRWQEWWPGLRLTVFMDRGLQGMRWSVTGEMVGSSEIWLEQVGDGVLLHYYLRVDPTVPGSQTTVRELPDSPRGHRQADRLRRRHAVAWKRTVWRLKDELEAGRAPGTPRG